LSDEINNQKSRPFLSVHWKLFLVLAGLVSIIFALFFSAMLYFEQQVYEREFQQSKQEIRDSLNVALQSSSYNLSLDLDKLVVDTPQLIASTSVEDVAKYINTQVTAGYMPTNIGGLLIVDRNNKLHSFMNAQHSPLPVMFEGNIDKLLNAGFVCFKACYFIAAKSIVSADKVLATILVYQPVDAVLKRFFNEHKVSIGVLDRFPSSLANGRWHEYLFNIPQRGLNLTILKQLPDRGINLLHDENFIVSTFSNSYTVWFDNSRFENGQDYKWVFIKSNEQRNIWQNELDNASFFWFVVCYVLSLMVIYVVVDRICEQIPKILAISKALNVDDFISDDLTLNTGLKDDKRILDDELQQYDRNLAKISHKMDVLREVESNNAIKLQTMVRELDQTKSFIDRLLNDEQTVIMVQRLGGEIIALNRPGCELFDVDDFEGLTYTQLMCDDLSSDDGLAALNYLYLGGENLVKAETQWSNREGEVYTLLWIHTLLSVPGTIDPIILSVCLDITAQRKAEDRLEWLAFNDPTLINYNKQVFLEYIPFAINRSLERHKVLALLYCEVSGLPEKSGMDNTEIRNQIIKDVGVRMSSCLRQYDMLTQLSDDHFVITLEGLNNSSEAQVVIHKVIETYREPIEIGRKEYLLDVCIGASFAPDHTESVPQLLRNAELAQCEAKRQQTDFAISDAAQL
jgi:GGDEF domain-containing protein/PAS domain-containing protein